MDAPTLGVLRDTAQLVWLALLFGALAYSLMRALLPGAMVSIGRVQSGFYITADAVVVAALVMVLLSGLSAAGPEASGEKAAAELSLSGALSGIVMQLGICVCLLMYLRLFRGLSPAEVFGLRRLSPWRAVGMALLLVVPMLMLVNGTALGIHEWMKGFWPNLEGQETAEAFRRSNNLAAKFMLAISAAVVAPLVEEVVFRGFIYGVIKRHTDGIFAALCSSLLFAVVHLHVGTLVPLALLALIFCAVYEFTGCLLVPMLLHGLFNATSLMVMMLFPEIQP